VAYERIQKAQFIKVHRDPERQATAKYVDVFVGEILRDTFGYLLCSLSATLLTQLNESLSEYVCVAVEDAEDKGILRLE
jgi:hypothetical protein